MPKRKPLRRPDINAMARALGGDGAIEFETAEHKGRLEIVDGMMRSTMSLKRTISAEALIAAMKDDGQGKRRR